MPGKTKFNPDWLEKEEFKKWLGSTSSVYGARCKLCNTTIDVANMGISALRSHSKSKGHMKKDSAPKGTLSMLHFTTAKSSSTSTAQSEHATCSLVVADPPSEPRTNKQASEATVTNADQSTLASSSNGKLPAYLSTEATHRAEILWALKITTSHISLSACGNIGHIFKTMFPDSAIAQSLTCGENKMAYITAFGLGPFFADLVRQRVIKAVDGYVLMFDESLNKELGKKQMDIHVRFWDHGKIHTRYYSSVFLGHATAETIADKLESALDCNTQSLIQLSMDGPNVNWKVLRLLQESIQKRPELLDRQLINVGSCGLHVIHNSFQAGHAASGWDLGHLLSSLSWLFKDTPARREDFTDLTGCTDFPLDHCAHRWLENVPVAERALNIWGHIKKFIKHLRSHKPLKTKSFEAVERATRDPLVEVKLECFLSLAKTLQPLLVKYQTNNPMLPFLAVDIYRTMKALLGRFIKKESLEEVTSPSSLVKLEIREEMYLVHSKVDLGFKANRRLETLRQSCSAKEVLALRMEAISFMKAIFNKVKDKSPLTSILVCNLQWLDPSILVTNQEAATAQFKRCLRHLADISRVDDSQGDQLLAEFCQMLEFVKNHPDEFQNFKASEGLDIFFHETIGQQENLANLWKHMKPLLLLSHGQAQVERGFSVNKETMTVNLKEHSLVARRSIIDFVQAVGGLDKVEITPSMMVAASSARARYRQYLDSEKKLKNDETKKRKREDAVSQLEELKAKKKKLEREADDLEESATQKAEKAEEVGSQRLFIESNALRRTAKEKKTGAKDLEQEIAKQEAEISALA